jgi:hypothetical protein
MVATVRHVRGPVEEGTKRYDSTPTVQPGGPFS